MTTTTQTPSGAIHQTVGTWTHTVGAAMETLEVSGIVYRATFMNNDSSGTRSVEIPISISTASNISTITIYNNADVTAGTFIVDHVG